MHVSVPGKVPHQKVRQFTRRQRHAASKLARIEARRAAKSELKWEKAQERRDGRRLAAFDGIPAESTLRLLGVEA